MSNPVHDRLELILEHEAAFRLQKVFEERRAVLKDIPGFWPTALHNHALLAAASGYADDQKALGFLQDVWVARNPRDHRAYSIEFVCTSVLGPPGIQSLRELCAPFPSISTPTLSSTTPF
jgi:Nucleosome assembly protein (NAP)